MPKQKPSSKAVVRCTSCSYRKQIGFADKPADLHCKKCGTGQMEVVRSEKCCKQNLCLVHDWLCSFCGKCTLHCRCLHLLNATLEKLDVQ